MRIAYVRKYASFCPLKSYRRQHEAESATIVSSLNSTEIPNSQEEPLIHRNSTFSAESPNPNRGFFWKWWLKTVMF